MKNSLSLIYFALKDALAANPGVTAWGPQVDVVEERGAQKSETLWWVRAGKPSPLKPNEVEALKKGGFIREDSLDGFSKRLGRSTVKAYAVYAEKLRKGADALERTVSEVQILTQKNKELERELRMARETNSRAFDIDRFTEELRGAFKIREPKCSFDFKKAKPRKVRANAGVPTLMLSDWHWGEVVKAESIEGLNEYNIPVAKDRARRVFETTMEVLFHHQSGMSYEALVLSLAGDMLSGNIHEELRATNERPLTDCMLDLAETLADSIIMMADNFPGIYVPAVSGNHGRLDFKPTAKNAAVENMDHLLYRMVALMVQAKMGSKCNVDFDISRSLDMRYSVYDTRYLLTHGDQLNSSTNAEDFWASMAKLASRKQERGPRGAGPNFDYMTVGHFHKYGTVGNMIVNGSLKGYCEWVYKKNYSFERPIQALWITHPDHKVTSHIPIYGDEPYLDDLHNLPPITKSSFISTRR